MPLRILHELPFLAICYDPRHHWLLAEWHGSISLARAREGGEAVLACVRTAGSSKLLNDNRLVTDMWLEKPDWQQISLFPHLYAAGLRYIAWVYSPNLYGRFSVDHALDLVTHPVARTFEDLDLAQQWLQHQ
ncbi:hypothetical protein [Hymenobacter chitinivorans]|uniref:SpoIIAA-like protein n=1 Tax=Hymenobacter chitinivorans DSM 11115 TaxID=1121954 RepID=A0A2M9B905_9BACT|nr:hypothetical protein [Hymenobacter chitinivorans]PJJ54432.1 hypothetical protein CLV45_2769 [Hymenobacter chitinivorans DSM 11115]